MVLKRRRLTEQRIFFPWERRSGRRRRFGVARARPFLAVGLAVLALVWIAMRERQAAGVRQTRATLRSTRSAVDTYLADHDGGCPPSMGHLVAATNLRTSPKDAWGRPLRLVCPGRREGSRYELMSDGPDGLPGGLDRIE